jgi:hypothetical protein
MNNRLDIKWTANDSGTLSFDATTSELTATEVVFEIKKYRKVIWRFSKSIGDIQIAVAKFIVTIPANLIDASDNGFFDYSLITIDGQNRKTLYSGMFIVSKANNASVTIPVPQLSSLVNRIVKPNEELVIPAEHERFFCQDFTNKGRVIIENGQPNDFGVGVPVATYGILIYK